MNLFPVSSGAIERASEQMSASVCATNVEQANEWAVQANERADERMAQYLRPYSWLF